MFTYHCDVGKQLRGSSEGRRQNPDDHYASTKEHISFDQTSHITSEQKVLLDFIISHSGHDERPYLKVKVFGREFLGLLDSGATRTIMGNDSWELLKPFGINLNSEDAPNCSVANGNVCESLGSVCVPMELMGKIKLVNVLIVPSLKHSLILGLDFWKSMEIVPNLNRDCWEFSCDEINVQNKSESQITDSNDLSDAQRDTLDKFINKKFELQGDRLGCTHLTEFEIQTDSPPIKQRYYPVSHVVQQHIDSELQKMIDLGIVEESRSPWSSPILLVRKKEGGYRFCVDYRKLNKVTKPDAYPLHFVSAILDNLKGAKYLSSIDIKSAYWQIPMKESSKEYTAFTIPNRGLYQFKRVPFGLKNAPAAWQRFIDRVIGPDLEPYAFVYLDDIIIISDSFEKHMEILEKIFSRLFDAGLTVNKEKCKFCRSELRYLGYVVDKFGLRVDPEKVEAILRIPRPSCVKEVRSFIGMASWYRRFIPDFSARINPLCQLLRKNSKWNWNSECEASFHSVKEYLISAPLLQCPDFSLPFIVQTDASNYGLGAVLSQESDQGERVICYLSRSLTKQERAYSTTEKELLCVVWALEKLRPYLEGTSFTVVTDHHSLIWLHNLKEPNGRLCRWAVRLQQFDFKIIHRKGKDHVVPDLLSRSVPVIDSITPEEDHSDFDINTVKDKWYLSMRSKILDSPLNFPQWRVENDKIFKYVKCDFSMLSGDDLNWKLVVPKENRSSVIHAIHCVPTSGHPGVFKTYKKICERYFWPKMRSDVSCFVKKCKICIGHKSVQKSPAGLLGSRPTITKPFQMLSIDLMGPLPRSTKGYSFIFVISDYFSKFVLTFPLRSANALKICEHLENDVFLLFGVPKYIIADNGTQFRGKHFTDLCNKYKVKMLFNALYHPQHNPVERVNRVVKTTLSCYVQENHRKWDLFLPSASCAIRTLVHEVTGFTPYFINFGREHIIRGDLHDITIPDKNINVVRDNVDLNRSGNFLHLYNKVKEKLERAYRASEGRYNLRRRPVEYNVGDIVWHKNHALSNKSKFFSAKLSPRYVGPFRIKSKLGRWSYELEDDSSKSCGIWHVNDLKEGSVEEFA